MRREDGPRVWLTRDHPSSVWAGLADLVRPERRVGDRDEPPDELAERIDEVALGQEWIRPVIRKGGMMIIASSGTFGIRSSGAGPT